MGDMKQHQPPLTIEEQIENLKSIGLVIKDEEYAQRILKDIKRLNSGQWDFLKIGENYWKLKMSRLEQRCSNRPFCVKEDWRGTI